MIRTVRESDKEKIVDIFCDNIYEQRSYISHGEIQMGIATDSKNLSDQYKYKWRKYLDAQIDEFPETILVYEQEGTIKGFIIGEIDTDRDEEFGVICDLVVLSESRNKKIGSRLLNALLNKFSDSGIKDYYLESGVDNKDAHAFFENKGFEKISSIFRLNNK